MNEKFSSVTTKWLEKHLIKFLETDKTYSDEIIKELTERVKLDVSPLNYQEQLRIILNEFDFDEASMLYNRMNYTWYHSNNQPPTASEIKRNAKRLLSDAWGADESLLSHEYTVSTGRLEVSRYIWDGIKILGLKLVAVESVLDYDWVVNSSGDEYLV